MRMNKRGRILSSVSVLALGSLLAGCEEEVVMSPPNIAECSVWEWETSEGAWECEDPNSEYEDYYYANGMFYPDTSSKAIKSKSVKKAVDKVTKAKNSTNKSSTTKGSTVKSNGSTSKSGLGSGSKGGSGG